MYGRPVWGGEYMVHVIEGESNIEVRKEGALGNMETTVR